MKGNEFIDLINRTWPKVGLTFLVIAIVGGLVAGIIIIIANILRSAAHKQQNEEKSLWNFYRLSREKDLLKAEAELLKAMVAATGTTALDMVFESLSLFEKSVEQRVVMLRRRGIDSDEPREELDIISRVREKLGYKNLPTERSLISTREISAGQRLAIRPVTVPASQTFTGQVADVSETALAVKIIGQGENPVMVKRNDSLAVLFTRGGDAEYSFKSRCLGTKGNNMEVLTIEHTRELKRKQLRNYVRLGLNVPMRFRVVRSSAKGFSTAQQEATIMDISGGGLSFRLTKPCQVGDVISISFDLPNGSFRGIMGRILRISQIAKKDEVLFYKHHVEFVDIENPEREKIIHYIFEKQREESQWR